MERGVGEEETEGRGWEEGVIPYCETKASS